ncbi:MAG: PLP-dependent aminotransferase family protein [Desulfobacter sp.]|nr:MAG: PLP-dependent aminotransferase family protein [Desulfobacter sp.]
MRKKPLYENVAEKILSLVDEGTFQPGERIPSIRALSRQFKVSINTVKTAYGFLEDRRAIESRPQSGYYVCPRLPGIPAGPQYSHSRRPLNPTEITDSEVVMRVMGDVMNPDLIQFGAAIPDPELIPVKKLNRMLASENRRFPGASIGYAVTPGNKRLRTQISKRMVRAGCSVNPEEIIITNGASEAVFLALKTLCQKGDTLAIGTPIYFNFLQMIQNLGLKVLEIPMCPTRGIEIDLLEKALERHSVAACLILSNFNNPLGNCMPDEAKQALLQVVKRAGVPLIEDDINGDLSFSGHRPSMIKSWDDQGHSLLCASFSKSIAPGYRVGWIVPGRHFDAVMYQKLVINIATPTPTQLAMAEFLVSGGYDNHLRKIQKEYAKKVLQMSNAVGRHFPSGTRITRPEGGFTLWIELPGSVDSLKLYSMAARQGISIAPGAIFSTTDQFRHFIRLNAAMWSDTTRWAVKALGKMVSDLI